MPTHNGFTWQESAIPQWKSPEFDFNPENESRTSMKGWCLWDEVVDGTARAALLGWAEVRNDWPGQEGKRYISRTNPYFHPETPDTDGNAVQYLMAKTLRVEGDLPEGMSIAEAAAFDEAKLTIGFASPSNGYRCAEDTEVTGPTANGYRGVPEEFFGLRNWGVLEQATVRSQTIPPQAGGGLVWAGTNPPRAASVTAFVNLHEADITIEWYPVPVNAYNEAAFRAIAGKTNNAPFPPVRPVDVGAVTVLGAMETKLAGTLVCGMPTKKYIRMGNGLLAYHVTIKMRWFPQGANSFFWWDRPAALGGPGYHRLERREPGGGTSSLYPSVDYLQAFIPP